MRTLAAVLIFTFVTFMGCASSVKTSKNEKQKTSDEENAAKAVEMMRQEEEVTAKENDVMLANEDLEKRKAELEKQSQELDAVKERLKKMGMAAVYVPVKKDGAAFSYPGGRVAVIRHKNVDDINLRSLNDVIQNQIERSRSDLDHYNSGFGGFETCLNDRLFVLYMSKDKNGMIIREWYETLDKCK